MYMYHRPAKAQREFNSSRTASSIASADGPRSIVDPLGRNETRASTDSQSPRVLSTPIPPLQPFERYKTSKVRRDRQTSTPARSSGRSKLLVMVLLGTGVIFITFGLILNAVKGTTSSTDEPTDVGPEGEAPQRPFHAAPGQVTDKLKAACPDYKHYSAFPHPPYSEPMGLPFQRPSKHCRTFSSPQVEKVIEDVTSRMIDKDLARLFENSFPNTLDTTIRWHVDGTGKKHKKHKSDFYGGDEKGEWDGAQSFIVTGDIDAEWLRDSTNQLLQYQPLAKKEKKIETLILGAINTQAEFVIESPYCNAFQPPPPSHLRHTSNGQSDNVHPVYDPTFVFECKYELDSLAHFLALSTQFYNSTGSREFLTPRWYTALDTVLQVLDEQAEPTFRSSGAYQQNVYTFQRTTDTGTETLNLRGIGNPLNGGTGLIRSAFRPSDDATILGYYIPANAMMAVQLKRLAEILRLDGKKAMADNLQERGSAIEKAVWEHGVVKHNKWGDVFAYEVDGYGSTIIMDDANLPSLLSLPILGFVDRTDKTYQNTRKMLLSKAGNPYYLKGRSFHGIGGPHIGVTHAWPMSLLVQAMTSDDDEEIMELLKLVLNASQLGLIHESINVNAVTSYTRSWFAWACSVFAQTILDIAKRKPHLIFGKDAEPYVMQ